MMIFLLTVSIIASFLLLAAFLSRLIFHRSLMATLVEFYLRLTEKKYTLEEVRRSIPLLPEKNDVPCQPPKTALFCSPVEEREYRKMQVYTFNEKSKSRAAVLYLHGGAYVRQPRRQHWTFIAKLSRKADVPFIVPLYPKAPNHLWSESYRLLTDLYLSLKNRYDKIVLAGDSSGGGLALGLCEYFRKENIPCPDELVLISPWVDITLANPDIPAYEKTDPIVQVPCDRLWGKAWAGDLDPRDYKVSPIYGDMAGLAPVTLFAGTREALLPDLRLLRDRLVAAGVPVRYIEEEGMNHVYPIYSIPEAGRAQRIIESVIERAKREKAPEEETACEKAPPIAL